jgi:hypothetical protein
MKYGEYALHFTAKNPGSDYPEPRAITVTFYGGTVEEAAAKARDEFALTHGEWELLQVSRP